MRVSIMTAIVGATISSLALAAPGDRVTFSGCPAPGVDHDCMVLTSRGVTYNISAAQPRITLFSRGIAGSGIVSDAMSYCMQGPVLSHVSYHHTRQRCPLPRER
jgi:hypothetical protein